MYLIRSPLEGVSPYLYSGVNNGIVIALEKASLTGTVLKSGCGCALQEGTVLSGKDLLECLVRSQRIITL